MALSDRLDLPSGSVDPNDVEEKRMPGFGLVTRPGAGGFPSRSHGITPAFKRIAGADRPSAGLIPRHAGRSPGQINARMHEQPPMNRCITETAAPRPIGVPPQ